MAKTYINIESVRGVICAEIARYDQRLKDAEKLPLSYPLREIEVAKAVVGRNALREVFWQINAIVEAERHAAVMALLDKAEQEASA